MDTKLRDLLEAPCCFCGYSGPGYYQKNTHTPNCPWHTIGGLGDREKELILFAKKGRLMVKQPTIDVSEYCIDDPPGQCNHTRLHDSEYALITNKAKLAMALHILGDILPGKEYGFDEKDYRDILKKLSRIDENMTVLIDELIAGEDE